MKTQLESESPEFYRCGACVWRKAAYSYFNGSRIYFLIYRQPFSWFHAPRFTCDRAAHLFTPLTIATQWYWPIGFRSFCKG
jgi:hypothetical protein